MKSHLGSQRFQLRFPRRLAVCVLALVSLLGWGGCASPGDSSPAPTPVGKTAPAPAPATGHSEVIILREGDVVSISFPGASSYDTTLPIRRDGKIALQLVGEVQASGLTIGQLQQSLISLYTPQIGHKDITVSLQSSSFPVYVTGAVVHPGKVLSDHPLTALEAVMEAGGFDYATANMRAVKIIRNENGVMKHYFVNLKRVLDGKPSVPFYLQPDDILYVSERFEWF